MEMTKEELTQIIEETFRKFWKRNNEATCECGSISSNVIKTITVQNQRMRIRKCTNCGAEYITVEVSRGVIVNG